MTIETIITIGGLVFSLGGAWFLVGRLKEDNKEMWSVLTKVRDWQGIHEKETAEKREFLLIKINDNATAIGRQAAQTDQLAKNMEKIDGKLDRMDEKMDRLIAAKG